MTSAGETVASNFEEWHQKCNELLLPRARILCKGAPWVDPRDLVQETFLRFIEGYGSSLGELDGKAKGRLIRILVNHYCDLHRGTMGRKKAQDDPTLTRWTLAQNEEPSLYERISPERFDWAVDQLPTQQRLTLLLRSKRLGNKEIARQLGVTPSTVAKRVYDACRNLEKLLKPYLDEGKH